MGWGRVDTLFILWEISILICNLVNILMFLNFYPLFGVGEKYEGMLFVSPV
jgi:hypothetical protein